MKCLVYEYKITGHWFIKYGDSSIGWSPCCQMNFIKFIQSIYRDEYKFALDADKKLSYIDNSEVLLEVEMDSIEKYIREPVRDIFYKWDKYNCRHYLLDTIRAELTGAQYDYLLDQVDRPWGCHYDMLRYLLRFWIYQIYKIVLEYIVKVKSILSSSNRNSSNDGDSSNRNNNNDNNI
jgi:hypothetical protein